MNKITRLLLILTVTGIFSCEKEPEEMIPEYPVTYSSYLISNAQINVYTKNGILTSPNLKDEIIQKYKNYLTDLENIEIEDKVVATYTSENTVNVTIDDEEEEKARYVYEKDGIIYWEKQDTLGMPAYPPLFIGKILTYHPLYYEEFDVPLVTGYSKAARYKECYYVKKKNEGFEIPMFDYLHKNEFGLLRNLGINNEVNENILSIINSNDTIIIQAFNVKLRNLMLTN
jgi:hypothetical protein